MQNKSFRVVVIGAGFAGTLMGIRLKQAGISDFVVYEKSSTVGGTWRDNVYPGVACDVPAYHYCYSFEPNPDWSQRFPSGHEIQRYIEKVIDKYGLQSHLRFGCEVTKLHWDGQQWIVHLNSGEQTKADVVVAATGVLHHPAYPELEGIDRFANDIFHTARWRKDVLLQGKRVGIIGTATTAAQVVPSIADRVRHLTVFQRTPNWILPVPNMRYSELRKRFLRRFPFLLLLVHRVIFYVLAKAYGEALVGLNQITSLIIRLRCKMALLRIHDRGLRKRLTPNYTPGCKRLVFSSQYYEALQLPNVSLVTEPIARVVPQGVLTVDGQLHEFDILLLATGFKTDAFMRPMELVGTNGITIDQVWAQRPIAYRSVCIPHMPNFFTLVGPRSPIATLSVIEVAEWQASYIMTCIQTIRSQHVAISPTVEATERYEHELDDAATRTVWTSGCQSWFLGKDGLPALYTLSPLRHRADMVAPLQLSDFDVKPLGRVYPHVDDSSSMACR